MTTSISAGLPGLPYGARNASGAARRLSSRPDNSRPSLLSAGNSTNSPPKERERRNRDLFTDHADCGRRHRVRHSLGHVLGSGITGARIAASSTVKLRLGWQNTSAKTAGLQVTKEAPRMRQESRRVGPAPLSPRRSPVPAPPPMTHGRALLIVALVTVALVGLWAVMRTTEMVPMLNMGVSGWRLTSPVSLEPL